VINSDLNLLQNQVQDVNKYLLSNGASLEFGGGQQVCCRRKEGESPILLDQSFSSKDSVVVDYI
jgi:hypothetical protein